MAKSEEPTTYSYIKIHWATKNVTAKPFEVPNDGKTMTMYTSDYMLYIRTTEFHKASQASGEKPRLVHTTHAFPTIQIAHIEAVEDTFGDDITEEDKETTND